VVVKILSRNDINPSYETFRKSCYTSWHLGPHRLLSKRYRGLFPRGKAAGVWSLSAEVPFHVRLHGMMLI